MVLTVYLKMQDVSNRMLKLNGLLATLLYVL